MFRSFEAPTCFDDRVINSFFFGRPEDSEKNKRPAQDFNKNHTTQTNALRVFIVEDERLIAENLKIIIEDQNWQVIGIVSSGEEAIRAADATNPDLILMDVRIQGDIDGVNAALVIYESMIRKPRILFLSAHPQEQFPHLVGLPPESFAYLKKPYTPEDLVAAIETLVF